MNCVRYLPAIGRLLTAARRHSHERQPRHALVVSDHGHSRHPRSES
jgi:hypothetical protein